MLFISVKKAKTIFTAELAVLVLFALKKAPLKLLFIMRGSISREKAVFPA